MKDTLSTSELTIGLDLGDTLTRAAVVDSNGTLVEESAIQSTPQAFIRFFERFKESVVVMEAGSQSRWASQLLKDLGLKVYVANPSQLPLIYNSKAKDDRLDAQRLARLGRLDPTLLYPIEHRAEDKQIDLEVIKAREILVKARTMQVNNIRGTLKTYAVKVKKCGTTSFAAYAKEAIPPELLPGLEPLLDVIEFLNAKISEYDKAINKLCKEKYKTESQALQQINGVGPIIALAFTLLIGDPGRFKNSRTAGSYFGLTPGRCESGDSAPQLSITRAGDNRMRVLLVQGAQYILGPFGKDCDLRRWGLRKAEHGGKKGKRKAVIAVARKLCVLMHRLLVTGEVYEPLRNSEKTTTATATTDIAATATPAAPAAL